MAIVSVYEAPSKIDNEGCSWYERISCAMFPSRLVGWAAGSSQILKSENGGQSWRNCYQSMLPNAGFVPGRVFAVDEIRSWVLATASVSSYSGGYTIDGGQSWGLVRSDSIPHPNDIFFLTPAQGWLVSDDGNIPVRCSKIHRTADGGETWKDLPLKVRGKPHTIRFLDSENGFLLVDVLDQIQNRYFTDFYRSADGGISWQLTHHFRRNIRSVCVLNDSYYLVAGENGFIAATSDRGKTWTSSKTRYFENLNSIDIYDRNLGAAVGDSGLLLITENGGKSWDQARNLGRETNLIRAHFRNNTEIVLVGDRSIRIVYL